MMKWEYKQQYTWILGPRHLVNKDDRGWYMEYKHKGDVDYPMGYYALYLSSYLYAGGKTHTRLPLNPERDWEKVSKFEVMTWDEDAGWADLAMQVASKMGKDGWELAGIRSYDPFNAVYIFKRPIE